MEISQEVPADCPDGYACYTDEDDAKLAEALLALENIERWSRLAWKSCKEESQEEVN